MQTQVLKVVYLKLRLANSTGAPVGDTVSITNSYIPSTLGSITSGKWYRVAIPFSDFGVSSTDIGGINVFSSTKDMFEVDDVRFLQS